MTDKNKLKAYMAKEMPTLYKHIFNEEPQASTPPDTVQMGTAKTTDGKELKWEGDMAEGKAVMLVSAEGESPAPDGEYALEDGTTLVIAAGMVSKVTTAPMPEMMTSEQVSAIVSEALSKQAEQFNKQIETLTKTVTDNQAAITEKFGAVIGALEIIAEVDAPATTRTDDPKRQSDNKRAMAFSKLQASISKLSTDKK